METVRSWKCDFSHTFEIVQGKKSFLVRAEDAPPEISCHVGQELVLIPPPKDKKRKKNSVAQFTGNTSLDSNIGGSAAGGSVASSSVTPSKGTSAAAETIPLQNKATIKCCWITYTICLDSSMLSLSESGIQV